MHRSSIPYFSGFSILGVVLFYFVYISCAAGFALLNLPKGKSLGRSKPETNSYAQALATHCVGFLLYPSSSELPYAK